VSPILTLSWDTEWLFLPVLAASVWVCGQLPLAALVPALRQLGADVTRMAARRFNQSPGRPSMLVVTGVWSMIVGSEHITGRGAVRRRQPSR
jgi:hypothetical protein